MRGDLKELIKFVSPLAEKIFRQTGQLQPMWHAVTALDQTLIIPQPAADKNLAAALIRLEFKVRNVDHYVFMSEAWILNATKSDISARDLRAIASEGLAEHPDRREIIMFSAENSRGETLTALRYILRPEHGRAKLSPLTIDDMAGVKSEGRLVGLLERKGATK